MCRQREVEFEKKRVHILILSLVSENLRLREIEVKEQNTLLFCSLKINRLFKTIIKNECILQGVVLTPNTQKNTSVFSLLIGTSAGDWKSSRMLPKVWNRRPPASVGFVCFLIIHSLQIDLWLNGLSISSGARVYWGEREIYLMGLFLGWGESFRLHPQKRALANNSRRQRWGRRGFL